MALKRGAAPKACGRRGLSKAQFVKCMKAVAKAGSTSAANKFGSKTGGAKKTSKKKSTSKRRKKSPLAKARAAIC